MKSSAIKIAKEVIQTEVEGLQFMSNQLNHDFEKAVEAIANTKGRAIICGMGKSGLIGKKIAATFASTGTPSFSMHPGEAFHGDLGMVQPEDVFIAISNSGETEEVLKLLPFLRDNKNFIIAMTGRQESTLAQNAHCHLSIHVQKEACPLQLAPTSSTTATLVMGDALAMALMEKRDFQPENFARFHPGGSLGRRLLSKVKDEMFTENLPLVKPNDGFTKVIDSISKGGLGITIVEMEDGTFGIITDGDLRRTIESKGKDAFDLCAQEISTHSPSTIQLDTRIHEAINLMEERKISSLLVLEQGKAVGVLKK